MPFAEREAGKLAVGLGKPPQASVYLGRTPSNSNQRRLLTLSSELSNHKLSLPLVSLASPPIKA